MSYAQGRALQEAVYARLVNDAGLQSLVGGAILDAPPEGQPPDIYLSLGPEDVRRRPDGQGAIVEHRFELIVETGTQSFAGAKSAAAAADAALTAAPLDLAGGRILSLDLLRVRAVRRRSRPRRAIEMTFRALVDES